MDDESFAKYEKLTEELNTIMHINGGFMKLMKSERPAKYQMLAKMTERKELVNNALK